MKVNYPIPMANNKNTKVKKTLSHGIDFENALNLSNEYYRNKNIALIYKKPTPIQVVRVDYPKRSMARIVEAYYKTPSTTDYNGVYRGKYIDYEAKETHNVSFYFKHIFEHQVKHLTIVDNMGGIGFVIINYKKVNRTFIIDIKEFNKLYLTKDQKDCLKSISVDKAEEIGYEVSQGYNPPLDYLKAVDKCYFSDK